MQAMKAETAKRKGARRFATGLRRSRVDRLGLLRCHADLASKVGAGRYDQRLLVDLCPSRSCLALRAEPRGCYRRCPTAAVPAGATIVSAAAVIKSLTGRLDPRFGKLCSRT
jgi:hypothetical protein